MLMIMDLDPSNLITRTNLKTIMTLKVMQSLGNLKKKLDG